MGLPGLRPRERSGPGALPRAISALSRALRGRPRPETFRKAKFDLPEAVAELWSLLFSLLWPVHQEGAVAPGDPPEALEGQIRFVKWVLHCYGYGRRHFYQLPEVGSHGSYELLLAFSWLLVYLSLPERFLYLNCVYQGDDAWICSCKDLASYPVPLALSCKGRVDIRYVQWLLGKLRFQWRSLYASQQEQCTLLNKIHLYTRGCHPDPSIGHLSVPEIELLRFPESSKQMLQQLESENSCLEAFLEWKHMELVYWQWMVSRCSQRLPRLPELSTAMMKEIQKTVECELAALEQGCGVKSWSHRLQRLVFREAGEPSHSGTHQMTKVIQVLRREEASLEKTFRRLQEECQQELAILARGLEGVIWILPP
ncbi:tubulin epsilon and delta complex protein 1 isoform X3 [Phascolarctos cinereus]|uniref:Uncharacterized protein C14orf80 homolog isoform X4 n=1 Tax=Phascolarctos cinereus TaxID=38626 RepID=A0A6P5J8Q9_PHACI|nr:uncharacterized protein C14orf80 homolog isoform X4 [Phascolarctos cinereus]